MWATVTRRHYIWYMSFSNNISLSHQNFKLTPEPRFFHILNAIRPYKKFNTTFVQIDTAVQILWTVLSGEMSQNVKEKLAVEMHKNGGLKIQVIAIK